MALSTKNYVPQNLDYKINLFLNFIFLYSLVDFFHLICNEKCMSVQLSTRKISLRNKNFGNSASQYYPGKLFQRGNCREAPNFSLSLYLPLIHLRFLIQHNGLQEQGCMISKSIHKTDYFSLNWYTFDANTFFSQKIGKNLIDISYQIILMIQ